jgi:hypothetical protein
LSKALLLFIHATRTTGAPHDRIAICDAAAAMPSRPPARRWPCGSVIGLLMPYASRHDAAERRQRVLYTELDGDEATKPAG